MTLEDKVNDFISIHYGDKKLQFCKDNGITYTTFLTAMKTGLNKSKPSTVAKILLATKLSPESIKSSALREAVKKEMATSRTAFFINNRPDALKIIAIMMELDAPKQLELLKFAKFLALFDHIDADMPDISF